MRVPFWMQDGRHFIWYRKVFVSGHSRLFTEHYLTFKLWLFKKDFKWVEER